ncbi:pilin [Sphaerisporangium sp. NPDC049003]|uniref:pilin n=1 Tax=Sphaerisporangium sp. NPDC049003 TaxID=3364517 RepID=UPI00372279EF
MSTYVRRITSADRSPLDIAEQAFQFLSCDPAGLAIDATGLTTELPQRPIRLTELRNLLMDRRLGNHVRDIVWRVVVTRAREEGAAWLVGAVGMAIPSLRRVAGRITSGYAAGDPADIDSEVLAVFVEAVRTVDLKAGNIRPRLCDAARRGGRRARKMAEAESCRRLPYHFSAPPHAPWNHPDLVLFDAVVKGVVSDLDAELIGRTRLEDMPIRQAAGELGLSTEAAKKRRQRSEPALVRAVLSGDVHAPMSPTIIPSAPRRGEVKTSAQSRSSSDAHDDHCDPKGGPGTASGSARSIASAVPLPQDGQAEAPTPAAIVKAASRPPGAAGVPPTRCPFCNPQWPVRRARLPVWQRRVVRVLVAVGIAVLVVATAATAALAETGGLAAPPSSPDQLGKVFDNLRHWLIGLLVALATLMFTIGGLRYLVAGGDPGEIQKAKAAFKAAALGYSLALLAPLFVNVLKRIVGG